jgi:hypothetical protein
MSETRGLLKQKRLLLMMTPLHTERRLYLTKALRVGFKKNGSGSREWGMGEFGGGASFDNITIDLARKLI